MQLTIYCFIALLAMGAAKPNPQKYDKRFLSQEFVLYLTPEEIKALQAVKESKNSGPKIESLKQNEQLKKANEGLQNYFIQRSQPTSEKPQIQDEAPQGVYLLKEKPVLENIQNKNFANFYLVKSKDQIRLNNQQGQNLQKENADKLESQIKTKSNVVPYVPVSYKNQEEKHLHEQLTQHWNRLLEHNRAQLQVLSEVPKEQRGSENSNQAPKSNNQQQIVKNQAQKDVKNENQQVSEAEDEKTEVEKEIDNILRSHQSFQSERLNPRGKQSPPILIHRQVSVTKHHPVPVYKQVKVPVPTPVLVPVPEPYAVRVLHPYPVPLEIVKHIPVPVIKN